MKTRYFFLAAALAVAIPCSTPASITNAQWWADGDGAVICNSWNWNSSEALLTMSGRQCDGVGHMLGLIQTSDPLDPTLTLSGAVNNDTGGAWIGYTINVIMSTNFSFVAPGPTVANPSVNDWFVASVINPTLQVSGPHAGMWEGTLNFASGTPIGMTQEMDFLYSISFSGGLGFNFTQEMIPIFTMVPEPGTLVLAGMGGIMLALRLRRRVR
jgi:hypothetical protein